jgi:mannitol/fructose-specific phosphotransferase system IIA component (Ntr-type)
VVVTDDDAPVPGLDDAARVFLLLLYPTQQDAGQFLLVLAALARRVQHPDFVDDVIAATDDADLRRALGSGCHPVLGAPGHDAPEA